MNVYGKIEKLNKKNRLISIINDNKMNYYHMTNADLKEFKNYLVKKPYVFLEVSEEKEVVDSISCYPIEHFIKILVPDSKCPKVYYNLNDIKKEVREFVNSLKYKLFLDLEFSWPIPYTHMPSEIIQYGYVIEDENGNVIEQEASLLRPVHNSALNKRTLNFLSRQHSEFDNAAPYIEFYQLLEKAITNYNVKIIAWGRNDILALEQSFKLNHLKPLDIRNRYINLMQVMKNYYNLKKEIGLFSTYQELANIEEKAQVHDALEDAVMAKDIFHFFKNNINNEDIN